MSATGGAPRTADTQLGIRGPGNPSARWAPLAALFDDMTQAHATGGFTASEPFARRIYEATLVDDLDGEGFDVRARALSNLAAAADARGDLDGALSLVAECLAACDDAERLIADTRNTSAIRVGARVNRAQMLMLLGRNSDALADLDAAAAGLPDDPGTNPLLPFAVHNTLGNALAAVERWEEAEAAHRAALDVALTQEPRLAAQAYAGLALVAHRTGDRDGSREQFRLARDLHGDDAEAAATTEENLARLAIETGDLEEAEHRFEAAERGYAASGQPRQAAGCRYGRAVVLFQRTRLMAARGVALAALKEFREHGDVWAQIETYLLLGDVHITALRYADGDEFYLGARALCTDTGAMHEVARIDVRRAIVAALTSHTAVRPSKRRHRLSAALNLALPAAIATDAMRHRFAPGPVRERWVREVASVALKTTFEAMTGLGETHGAIEFMELVSASVTLDVSADAPAQPSAGDLEDTVPTSPFRSGFALTAGGAGAGGSAGTDRTLALPPRVRALPGAGPALEEWIAEAENRYGVIARSPEVVDAW